MKIIRRGKPLEPQYGLVRFTCSSCKSVLEANVSEGELTEDRGRDFLVFKCPVCKQSHWEPV